MYHLYSMNKKGEKNMRKEFRLNKNYIAKLQLIKDTLDKDSLYKDIKVSDTETIKYLIDYYVNKKNNNEISFEYINSLGDKINKKFEKKFSENAEIFIKATDYFQQTERINQALIEQLCKVIAIDMNEVINNINDKRFLILARGLADEESNI